MTFMRWRRQLSAFTSEPTVAVKDMCESDVIPQAANQTDGANEHTVNNRSVREKIQTSYVFLRLRVMLSVVSFVRCCLDCTKSQQRMRFRSRYISKSAGMVASVILFLSFTSSCLALRVNYVQVPHYQKSGDPVKLECNFDLEGDVLYSVKWYRGNHEFFRYVPGDNSPLQVFDLEGVIVDTALSDSSQVSLRSVSRKSSGRYKCEVSADAPSFHTASKSAEMLVVDLPESVPNITGSRSKYHVGDEVHVNCSSISRPASSLKWYINGKPVASERLVEYAPEKTKNDLEISRLGLKFIVGAKDFPSGTLKIKCSATTAAVYYQSSEEAVEGQFPQTSPALESKGVYTGGSSSVLPQALGPAVILLHAGFYFKYFANL